MFQDTKDGQTPAFPGDLRDWFAGQALCGMRSSSDYIFASQTIASRKNKSIHEIIANTAYEQAEAMLRGRAKG